MGGRAVEVVIELLDVLAVVAFGIRKPEKAFLQDRVAAVPQCQAESEQQVVVAKASDSVLAPALGPAARMIVREIFPGRAVFAVILAHRSPLPLAEIRPPAPPMLAMPYFLEAQCFGAAKCPAHTFCHRLSSPSSGALSGFSGQDSHQAPAPFPPFDDESVEAEAAAVMVEGKDHLEHQKEEIIPR